MELNVNFQSLYLLPDDREALDSYCTAATDKQTAFLNATLGQLDAWLGALVEKLETLSQPPPPVDSPTSRSPKDFGVAAQGFWEGTDAVRRHRFDAKLAAAMANFLKEEEQIVTSVLELGAG